MLRKISFATAIAAALILPSIALPSIALAGGWYGEGYSPASYRGHGGGFFGNDGPSRGRCTYKPVQCFRAPCNPIRVCDGGMSRDDRRDDRYDRYDRRDSAMDNCLAKQRMGFRIYCGGGRDRGRDSWGGGDRRRDSWDRDSNRGSRRDDFERRADSEGKGRSNIDPNTPTWYRRALERDGR